VRSIYSRFVLAALVLLAGSALLGVARLLSDRSALERATAAALLWPALAIGLVEVLSPFGAIRAIPFLVGSGALLLGSLAMAGDPGRELVGRDLSSLLSVTRAIASSPPYALSAIVGLCSIGLAILSAYLFVPWAYDALGYHLPFVYDALAEGTLRTVPTHIPYVNAYPHLGDVFFVAFRLSLLDGTFIELAQLPFALLAVLSIALLARRAGAPTARALSLAMLFLGVPAVALQLAANYVDVAYAGLVLAAFAFASGPLEPRTLALFGIALGLAVGTKPSGPPMALLASGYLLVVAYRARKLGEGILAIAGAVAIGAWKYVENLAVHGNPVWPVEMSFGPIVLPGRSTVAELAAMGLGEPMRSHGWAQRIFDSWTTVFPDRYVYDMRSGGFGPLFAFVLFPAAIATLVASRASKSIRARAAVVALPVALVCIATLATPGAYWARYTIAVPAALLVLAIAASEALSPRMRFLGDSAASILGALGLLLAVPGYTVDAPSIFTFVGMDAHEREGRFGVTFEEDDFRDARALVGRGESFAYDGGYGLPGRLYPLDGRGRVVFLDHEPETADALIEFVEEENVRALAIGEVPFAHTADLARTRPDRFRELFRCPEEDPCSVFAVLPERASER
jgi:hypothetical protein